MAEGGFLIKFDGKEVERCYAVAFDTSNALKYQPYSEVKRVDYDERSYIINGKEKKKLPAVKSITIEVE